jgi:hypothetical protein
MKAVIASALVIIGVTQLVGLCPGSVISVSITMLLPHGPVKIRVAPLLEFFNGAAASAAALALFWLLSVSVSVLLPVIVAAWFAFYFFAYGQSKVAWFGSIADVLVFWAVYRLTIASLNNANVLTDSL